ncbi:MAG: hypothetical protein PHO75_00920 [Candidatus Shapirobacteria bacterium]|nr:hypothetical protein [Candidatus Shapirobacteria bacterium]
MKTISQIKKHLIGKIEGLKFELKTIQGYLSSHKGNPSYVKERKKEITELEIKIEALEELLKDIKN